MPINITMPALSPTMEKGNLVKWHKKEGDTVAAGDLLAEIETDKATMEVEAVDEGKIGKIVVPEGTKDVAVNSVIAILLEEGEDESAIQDVSSASSKKTEEKLKEDSNKKQHTKEDGSAEDDATEKESPLTQSPSSVATDSETKKEDTAVRATPLAKRISEQSSIDISAVKGSGSRNKVMKDDVKAHLAKQKKQYSQPLKHLSKGEIDRATPEASELPVSNIRSIIAKKLCEAKQQIPHFYLSLDCNIDKLLEMRADINSSTDAEKPLWKISVNDFVIKAASNALKQVPAANSSWSNSETLIQYNNVDMSVAVAIKDGLITPIIKNADQKSIFTISQEMKVLAKKAREGTLKPEEFQGGSASISNLGMYGIKQFNAIINSPQSCIFAVGAGQEVPAVVGGEVTVINIMNVTLSCDHRVVDGADGARLLNIFKEYIENPVRLLL